MVALLSMGFAAAAADVVIEASDFNQSTLTATKDGFTVKIDKANGTTAPAFRNDGSIRLYAKGTVTVSGENVSKVVFTLASDASFRHTSVTASTGTVATQASGDTDVQWTGDATSVTFTVGDYAIYGSDGETKAGQLRFSAITITGEGGEGGEDPTPDPQPEGTTYTLLTTMAAGNYIIGADDAGSYKAATAYEDGKTYGYMPVVDATVNGNEITTTASTYSFETAEGGYYIKDAKGNYLIQTGNFNSFNLVSTPSATEGVFTVTIAADGYATIVNTNVNKTMAYGVGFNSFGSYPELSETRVLPKLYVSKSDAISDITADENAPVEFFNLQGMRINEPAAGQIVIRRQGNQVSKILVK